MLLCSGFYCLYILLAPQDSFVPKTFTKSFISIFNCPSNFIISLFLFIFVHSYSLLHCKSLQDRDNFFCSLTKGCEFLYKGIALCLHPECLIPSRYFRNVCGWKTEYHTPYYSSFQLPPVFLEIFSVRPGDL